MPPLAASPWQAEHFSAKILAPCAGVPLPGGRLVPSGNTAISQFAISASVIGLPSRGEGLPGACASAAPAPSAARTRAKKSALLCIDMFDVPFGIDGPA